MPLTSASDIKSWTARSPTASTPHSHTLNRPREAQPSLVWPPPVRSPLPAASSSNPSRTPARNGRTVREQRARGVQSLPPVDENVGTGAATISNLLHGVLRLPEGHPRQQRVHRQSAARCDPCVVSGMVIGHTSCRVLLFTVLMEVNEGIMLFSLALRKCSSTISTMLPTVTSNAQRMGLWYA